MNEILIRLNEEAQARGSLVVTKDGILVASEMDASLKKDVVSALSSFLISAASRSLSRGKIGAAHRLVLTATHGKLVLRSLGDYFLVLLTDQFASMEVAKAAVESASKRLREIVTIRV
ncbi:MAG: hypothetical protein CSA62_13910 [Planctomycetota bacterium]|nr:MAG: hypothetical protein CSA62_13910 [Planctomycetota bacterium]